MEAEILSSDKDNANEEKQDDGGNLESHVDDNEEHRNEGIQDDGGNLESQAGNEEEHRNEGNQVDGGNVESCADDEEEEEPKVGMVFASQDDVVRYYTNYGYCKGFGIAKISSKHGDDGKKYFTLACNCARKYVSSSKNLLKQNSSTKTQCKARLNACVCLDGTVVVSRVVLEHNHELRSTKACHSICNKKLGLLRKSKFELNDQVGPNLSKNFRSPIVEANGCEHVTFGGKNCKNYLDRAKRLRLGTGDAEAIQNYFARMQKQNSNFYHVIDLDDRSRLRNVFWADARSRAACEYFGNVVTVDSTYLKNKYELPLVSFVGVNHHGQLVLLGCALLSNEDTKTFIWLFKTWIECMSGHAPYAIITDQDRALQYAIEVVFPLARHRWCLWNLMKRIPEKFGRHSHYESIKTLLHVVVYDSLNKNDFMMNWEKMVEGYNLHENEWLKWVYSERQRWVPVYVVDTFWAGMSTTKQSECVNSFFDGYVDSKTTLKQFIEQYDNALKEKVEKENLADFASFSAVIPCVSHFGFESQFQKAFTNAKFKEFQDEVASMLYCNTCFEKKEGLTSIYYVVESKKICEKIKDITVNVFFNEKDVEIRCACCLFEFKGILCRHILCVLKLIGKSEFVPPKYVFSQWRKDIKRRYTLIRCSFDLMNGNLEFQWLNEMCNAFYEVASTGVNSEDDFLNVMSWIKDIKLKLSRKEISCDTTIIPKQVDIMFDPLAAHSPPSKRKASKIDQTMKKNLAKKKTQNIIPETRNFDLCEIEIQGNEGEGFLGSQIIDGCGTQDNTHAQHQQKSQPPLQDNVALRDESATTLESSMNTIFMS